MVIKVSEQTWNKNLVIWSPSDDEYKGSFFVVKMYFSDHGPDVDSLRQGGHVTTNIHLFDCEPLKVLSGFYWHAQRRLVMGQGRDDWILVMFWNLEGFWPLIFHRSKAKLKGQGALIGTLYHYYLYIHIPPNYTTGVKVMKSAFAV